MKLLFRSDEPKHPDCEKHCKGGKAPNGHWHTLPRSQNGKRHYHPGRDAYIDFETACKAHRSHSPNTTSIAPRMAVASGNMWPLDMKSIACRCENAVGLILQR